MTLPVNGLPQRPVTTLHPCSVANRTGAVEDATSECLSPTILTTPALIAPAVTKLRTLVTQVFNAFHGMCVDIT